MITRDNYETFFVDYIDGNLSKHDRVELEVFLLNNIDLADELDDLRQFILKAQPAHFDKTILKKQNNHACEYSDDDLIISLIESDCTEEIEQDIINKIESSQHLMERYKKYKLAKLTDNDTICNFKHDLYRLPDFNNSPITVQNVQMFIVAQLEGDLSKTKQNELATWLSKSPTECESIKSYAKARLKPDKTVIFTKKNRLKKRKGIIIKLSLYGTTVAAAAVLLFAIRNSQFETTKTDILTSTISAVNDVKTDFHQNSEPQNIEYIAVKNDIEKQFRITVKPKRKQQIEPVEVKVATLTTIQKLNFTIVKSAQEYDNAALATVREEELQQHGDEQSNNYLFQSNNLFSKATAFVRGFIAKKLKTGDKIRIEQGYNNETGQHYFALYTPIFSYKSVKEQ